MSKQENIIFLISQPRAGSTLTQKLIGNHPDVLTVSEPWILLHPLSALRSQNPLNPNENLYHAVYDAPVAEVGVNSFLDLLPGKEAAYIEQLADLYAGFYQQITESKGKTFFLDKTPRYYHIIPELAQAFPQAHFIFLLRNPLAVLCSIINVWIQDYWLGLRLYKHDMMTAPTKLLEGIELLGDRATVIHYESLLKDPEPVMTKMAQKLGIKFSTALTEYGEVNPTDWKLGDPSQVYQHNIPDSQNAQRWTSDLSHPQKWRLASDYLQQLGPETIQKLGYDYSELERTLAQYRPGKIALWKTLPLDWVLKSPQEFASINYGYWPVKLANLFQRKGSTGVAKAIANSLSSNDALKKKRCESNKIKPI